MARLSVRNLPDSVYQELQLRARRRGHSVAQEVIQILGDVLEEAPKDLSILDLQGLGKECWQRVDVSSYVDDEREW